MLFNKKASLEISVQAIIIVVLAMTLLGFGLGFIRDMFKNITGTTADVSEQIKEQILNDLRTGDKKLSFPKTEIKIDIGGSEILGIGVRNKKDVPLHYRLNFKPISDPNGNVFSITNPDWFQYAKDDYTLAPADAEVRSVRLFIPTGVSFGSYFLTFEVIDADTNLVYAQKDFFVFIRG